MRRRSARGLLGIAIAFASLAPAWPAADAAAALPRSRIVGAGGEGMFTVDHAGGDRRLLFRQQAFYVDDGPMHSEWSPDGSWIAYANHGEIWVIRPDGTGKRVLTAGTNPVWSADGRIVYTWTGEGFYVDGTPAPPATPSPVQPNERDTMVSPDGRRVAFAADTGDGRLRTYVRNADGSGLRAITTGGMDELPADWSPDGRSLLINANDHMIALWTVIVDVDAGTRRQVMKNFVPLAFSPDGRKVLAYQSSSGQTHTMNIDGTALTSVPALQGAQDWGPGSVDRDPEPPPPPPTSTTAAPPPLPVVPTTAPRTKTTTAARAPSAPQATTSTSQPAPAPDAASLSALASSTGEVSADAAHAALARRAVDASRPVGRAPFIAVSVALLVAVGVASGLTALLAARPRR